MARLLVVSRSMALAMRLADAHQVVEHPVEDIDRLVPGDDVDVVVLDVGEPTAAIHALDRLRASGRTTPVLVVSGYQPAWANLVSVDLPDVIVVPLPITRAALLSGIAELSRQAAPRGGAVAGGYTVATPFAVDRAPVLAPTPSPYATLSPAQPDHSAAPAASAVADDARRDDTLPAWAQPPAVHHRGRAARQDSAPELGSPELRAPEVSAPGPSTPVITTAETEPDEVPSVRVTSVELASVEAVTATRRGLARRGLSGSGDSWARSAPPPAPTLTSGTIPAGPADPRADRPVPEPPAAVSRSTLEPVIETTSLPAGRASSALEEDLSWAQLVAPSGPPAPVAPRWVLPTDRSLDEPDDQDGEPEPVSDEIVVGAGAEPSDAPVMDTVGAPTQPSAEPNAGHVPEPDVEDAPVSPAESVPERPSVPEYGTPGAEPFAVPLDDLVAEPGNHTDDHRGDEPSEVHSATILDAERPAEGSTALDVSSRAADAADIRDAHLASGVSPDHGPTSDDPRRDDVTESQDDGTEPAGSAVPGAGQADAGEALANDAVAVPDGDPADEATTAPPATASSRIQAATADFWKHSGAPWAVPSPALARALDAPGADNDVTTAAAENDDAVDDEAAAGEQEVASGEHDDEAAAGEHEVASGEHDDEAAAGEHEVASGEHEVASGEHEVASGEHEVASGEHEVASGEHDDEPPLDLSHGSDTSSRSDASLDPSHEGPEGDEDIQPLSPPEGRTALAAPVEAAVPDAHDVVTPVDEDRGDEPTDQDTVVDDVDGAEPPSGWSSGGGWAAQDFDWWRSPMSALPDPEPVTFDVVPSEPVLLDPEPLAEVQFEAVVDDVAPEDAQDAVAGSADGTAARAISENPGDVLSDPEPVQIDPEPLEPEATGTEPTTIEATPDQPTEREPVAVEPEPVVAEQPGGGGEASPEAPAWHVPAAATADTGLPETDLPAPEPTDAALQTAAFPTVAAPVASTLLPLAPPLDEPEPLLRVSTPLEAALPVTEAAESLAATIARRRALLGRPEPTPGPSALARRLAGRAFETSLGPGGTSAELVALGMHPDASSAPVSWQQTRPSDGPVAPPPPAPAPLPMRPSSATSRPAAPPPPGAPSSTAQRPSAPPPAATSYEPPPPTAPVNQRELAMALVRGLTEHVQSLFGVGDTAQVLADEVVERADADAAAILVPDGSIWRVSGGVGLRPLERRLVLDAGHWLISEIAISGRALLVEDTDIVRPKLAGAPLAAWRHLLAVPVPDVKAAVLLARGHEGGAFGENDLAAIVGPVREAAALLGAALETRHLARMLDPLREADPHSR